MRPHAVPFVGVLDEASPGHDIFGHHHILAHTRKFDRHGVNGFTQRIGRLEVCQRMALRCECAFRFVVVVEEHDRIRIDAYRLAEHHGEKPMPIGTPPHTSRKVLSEVTQLHRAHVAVGAVDFELVAVLLCSRVLAICQYGGARLCRPHPIESGEQGEDIPVSHTSDNLFRPSPLNGLQFYQILAVCRAQRCAEHQQQQYSFHIGVVFLYYNITYDDHFALLFAKILFFAKLLL